ncbi:MAG: DNA mismatch endonuclease Vsr [Candidatus Scalindua sp.]|nr:DNA mismatch endonuclease Vsr [Candidatus Scalindua sp.]
MSRIASKNTKPEIVVRSALHGAGFRFRLHRKDLPGKPDIGLPKYKTVIFIHGCFWHAHKGCKRSNLPKSNLAYWKGKLAKNVQRDRKHKKKLQELGFNIYVIWECQTKKMGPVINKFKRQMLKDA